VLPYQETLELFLEGVSPRNSTRILVEIVFGSPKTGVECLLDLLGVVQETPLTNVLLQSIPDWESLNVCFNRFAEHCGVEVHVFC